MAQFIRTRVRCSVYPSKVGTPFQSQEGSTPKIYKGAGCEFEICFFTDVNNLFDVGNISSLSLMAKLAGQPTTAPVMLKTTGAIVSIEDIEAWKDGSQQHAVIVFTAIETNVAAGTYDVTLFGLTNDDGLDTDVFGMTSLQIIDAGLTNTVSPAVGAAPAMTTDQFNIAMEDYVKKVRNPGDLDVYVSPNGTVRLSVGVGDNHERISDLEDV